MGLNTDVHRDSGYSLAVRSYEEIRTALRERHGWKMSRARVYQILQKAEEKLRRRLHSLAEEL